MARTQLKEEEKRRLNKENFTKLYGIFKYLLPYKGLFISGLVCLVIGSFLLLAFPYVAGKLIDVASGKSDWFIKDINSVALGLVVILFLQSIISFLRVYLFAQVSERAMSDVRSQLYEKLIHLPTAFFDKYRTGDLMSRVSSDVSLLQTTFSTTLAEVIRQVVTLIVGIAVIFATTPSLSVFMLATFPILVIFAMVFGKRIRKLSRASQDELAKSSTIVEETLQSILAVKTFTNEIFEKDRYKSALDKTVDLAIKAATFRAFFISFIIFGMFGGIVAIMWYGAYLLQTGEMSVGDLISFVLYTTFIGGSIAGLGDLFGQLQRAIGASERILEVHDEVIENNSGDRPMTSDLSASIAFKDLNFAYPGRKEISVLKNLNLEIKAGEKVALIGKSGAGKSTISQLLMRLYDGYTGEITIDGQEVSSYNLKSYRQNIGVVPQEIILFGGSIRENIVYGKPDATEEEVREAAKQSNALEFIESFPEGFDTLVGERGVKLSGGQRQRIAIARTILKNPTILILDEATSSLDAESESLVQEALNELMKNRTTLVIAHRLATIKEVDRIFVLENGQVVESGSHQELLALDNSKYTHMVNLQLVS
ncbi:ABC transporter ATP-binding protein [Reichenbachiella versicolor]|uniref:ABC transporter ATP-binding protein n=1 Tax=Reichenbachiella versicolor TaxID=1821036 RepID=UPI000D6DE4F7|nr:ABC transporter transmembrane domain-containing protein [Reichenbachiella versicolor]